MKSFLIDDIEKLKYLWNTKHPLFAKRLQKNLGFQQVAMRMRERWPALESFLTPEVCIAKFLNLRTYYRKEKKKLTCSKSGTGAVDFFPKKEHFTRLQFLEDIINPVVCHPNLDDMELEINATLLEVTVSLRI
ncbi:MADF domain-containing protein [Trichonephila clavata]|uniref:MADF domain-containing protein n=1 Tax=Trichonephila clavata TaxID=2740835 RepID=A0A8X6GCY2_TRICU|nr:MADF domain-containing protein [Trichonephila clavata]